MDIRKIEYELPAEDRYPESEYGWRGIVPAKNLGIARPLVDYRWSATTVSSDYVTDGIELVTNDQWGAGNANVTVEEEAGGVRVTTIGDWGYAQLWSIDTFNVGDMVQVSLNVVENNYSINTQSTVSTLAAVTIPAGATGNFTGVGIITTGYQRVQIIAPQTLGLGNILIDNISVQKVIQKPNTMYLTDTGSKPKYPAEMKSGQGVKFAVDQSIPIDDILPSLIKSISGTVDGDIIRILGRADYGSYLMFSSTQSIIQLSGGVINFTYRRPLNERFAFTILINNTTVSLYVDNVFIEIADIVGTITNTYPITSIGRLASTFANATLKDLYIFNDTLTATEISKYSTNPNGFYQDVKDGVIDNCVLNMPLDGTDATVHDYVNNTDYTIANYTVGCRNTTSNLNYGTQELNFLRDGLWRGDLSSYLECNGSGYVDTGWVPDSTIDFTVEIVKTKDTYQCFDGVWGTTDRLNIGTEINGNIRIDVGLTNKYLAQNGFNVTPSHVVVQYTASNKEVQLFENGIIAYTFISDFTTPTASFQLGSTSATGAVSNSQKRLFKVHTEPQDPLELYNNAVSKGLLI